MTDENHDSSSVSDDVSDSPYAQSLADAQDPAENKRQSAIAIIATWLLAIVFILFVIITFSLGVAAVLAVYGLFVLYIASLLIGPEILTDPGMLLEQISPLMAAIVSPDWLRYELPIVYIVLWAGALYGAIYGVTWAKETLEDDQTSSLQRRIGRTGVVALTVLYVLASAASMYLILYFNVTGQQFSLSAVGSDLAGALTGSLLGFALVVSDGGSLIIDAVEEGVGFILGVLMFLVVLIPLYFVFIGLILLLLWPPFGTGLFFGPYHNLATLPTSWKDTISEIDYWIIILTSWESVALLGGAALTLMQRWLDHKFGPLSSGFNLTFRSVTVGYVIATLGVAAFVIYDHLVGHDVLATLVLATIGGVIASFVLKFGPVTAIAKWVSTPAVWLLKKLYSSFMARVGMRKWARIGYKEGKEHAQSDLAGGHPLLD